MARAKKEQIKAENAALNARRAKNNRPVKHQINDIKLNDFGFPILPEFDSNASETKVAMSGTGIKGNGMKAYIDNPTKFKVGRGARGLIEKVDGVPYVIQRKVARNFILHGMIMRLRASQIRKYAVRSEGKDKPGFKVRLKDIRRAPTKIEQKLIDECETWIFNTGRRDFEGAARRKDRLPQYTEKFVRDTLTIDRIATSMRFDRTGEMVDFALVDGATIIPVNPYEGFDGDLSIEYVQEVNGQIIEKFHTGEMMVDWLYQTSEVDQQYYGWSGIEEAFKEIMATINALKYNSGNFTTNKTPKGFFSTDEEIDQSVLNDIEERFAALFSGADGAWRTPFFGGATNLRYNPIQSSNRDMEFTSYMNLLFSLYLALFNVDPAELGLRFNESAAMINNTGGGAAQQGDRSKERGIIDLLEFKARHLNAVLDRTKRFADLEIIHTGTEVIDKTADLQNIQQMQSTIYSTDQLRAQRDEPPLWQQAKDSGIDDEQILDQIKLLGSLPTSPTAMALFQNIMMQAAQQQQMEQQMAMQGGAPGAEGDPNAGGGEPGADGQPGGDEEGGDELNPDDLPEFEEEPEHEGAINLTTSKEPKELQKSRKFTVEL